MPSPTFVDSSLLYGFSTNRAPSGRFLKEITGFHGAYDSSAARRDVPEFVCDVDLTTGAAEVFTDQRGRGKWKDSRDDFAYQAMVDEA
jgi:hypothetical protein